MSIEACAACIMGPWSALLLGSVDGVVQCHALDILESESVQQSQCGSSCKTESRQSRRELGGLELCGRRKEAASNAP